jgi:hypothetical protein
MAIPAQEQVMQAVEAALKGIAAVPGLEVERDRIEMPDETEMPRLILNQGSQADATDFTGEDGYALTITIEGWVKGEDAAAARLARAVLQAEVHKALFDDPTLGGAVRIIRPPDEPPPERLDLAPAPDVLGFELSYVVEYATAEGDPYTLI